MLNCSHQAKTDLRCHQIASIRCTKEKRHLDKTHDHEEHSPTYAHPACEARGRSSQVHNGKGKKQDQKWANRLEPCPDKNLVMIQLAKCG